MFVGNLLNSNFKRMGQKCEVVYTMTKKNIQVKLILYYTIKNSV